MNSIVKIVPNDRGNPPGKLADAELHFTDDVLDGLKLIGFGIWERRGGGGRNVTFPARQHSSTVSAAASPSCAPSSMPRLRTACATWSSPPTPPTSRSRRTYRSTKSRKEGRRTLPARAASGSGCGSGYRRDSLLANRTGLQEAIKANRVAQDRGDNGANNGRP